MKNFLDKIDPFNFFGWIAYNMPYYKQEIVAFIVYYRIRHKEEYRASCVDENGKLMSYGEYKKANSGDRSVIGPGDEGYEELEQQLEERDDSWLHHIKYIVKTLIKG